MAIQNNCSTLSLIPTLDLMFLHKDFALQTCAGFDWLVHTRHSTVWFEQNKRQLKIKTHSDLNPNRTDARISPHCHIDIAALLLVRLILNTVTLFYFLSWQFMDFDLYKSLFVKCSVGHLRKKIAIHVHSAKLKLGSDRP